jgi:Na+/H+-dicarboxylate symporter
VSRFGYFSKSARVVIVVVLVCIIGVFVVLVFVFWSFAFSSLDLLADSSDPQRTLSSVSIARVTESGPSNSS